MFLTANKCFRVGRISRAFTTSAIKPTGIIEVRTYEAKPDRLTEYLKLANASATLRTQYLGDSWKLFLQAEVGYGSLGDVVHMYTYADMQARENSRKLIAQEQKWREFLVACKPCLVQQRSEIFVPSYIPTLQQAYFNPTQQLGQLGEVPLGNTAVYEIRHYQLRPGYDTIPHMLDIFARGLPDKLSTCDPSTGELVLLCHSDMGELNQFIEVWRYPSSAASVAHREASRKAIKWRAAIAEAAKLTVSFRNRLMTPTSFSPLK